MRRPTKTKAQRAYDKMERALRRLTRAAVRYADQLDLDHDDDEGGDELTFRHADLQGAAISFAHVLSPRERKKAGK